MAKKTDCQTPEPRADFIGRWFATLIKLDKTFDATSQRPVRSGEGWPTRALTVSANICLPTIVLVQVDPSTWDLQRRCRLPGLHDCTESVLAPFCTVFGPKRVPDPIGRRFVICSNALRRGAYRKSSTEDPERLVQVPGSERKEAHLVGPEPPAPALHARSPRGESR